MLLSYAFRCISIFFHFPYSVRLLHTLCLSAHWELAYPRSTDCPVFRVCGVLCDPTTHKHTLRPSSRWQHHRKNLPRHQRHPGCQRYPKKCLLISRCPRAFTPATTSTFTASRGPRPPDDPGAAQPGTTVAIAPISPSGSNFPRNGRTGVPRPRTPKEPGRMGESQALELRSPEATRAHYDFHTPDRPST